MAFNIRSMVINTSGRIQSRSVVPTDPYFSSVTLLLQAETTNTDTFVDSSTNNASPSITGTTVVQGSVTPFTGSGGSVFMSGSSYISLPSSAAFNWNAGGTDLTIECWVKLSEFASPNVCIWTTSTALSDGHTSLYYYPDGSIEIGKVGINNLSAQGVTAGVLQIGVWTHIAVVRKASTTTTTIYINGTSVASGTTNVWSTGNRPFAIGKWFNSTPTLRGYVSNLRVVNGTEVYTGNFTPSTSPLTAITNTSLLLKFENAKFLDGSRKNMIVPVGSVAISTSVFKYGTGAIHEPNTVADYLEFFKTSGNNFLFTGDFTIEQWVYVSTGGEGRLFVVGNGTTHVGLTASTTNFNAYIQSAGPTITSATVVTNTWQHVALVRVGSTVTFYVGGVSRGTTTNSGTLGYTNPIVSTLGFGGSTGLRYFDEVRVTKGVARYTANFTPPTEAFLSA